MTLVVHMFLNGGGMRGGPVHHHIAAARFVGETRTAPTYRVFAIRGTDFPGLVPVEEGGVAIAGELYDATLDQLAALMPAEPPELELGVIELADGSHSLAMILRSHEVASGKHTDISDHGGWRAYLATLE
jgi:gamma-glutamylcyclotransferase (GGCT)/AIG2-like uncharacterized protein YtfP